MSWYNLPTARYFKPIFEFWIPPAPNYPAGTSELIPLAPTRIYVEIVHNVDIVSLALNYPADTSELFPLGANSDLHINCTLHINCLAVTSEFISFWRQLRSPLGMKIPGDSFSGIPLRFFWCLGINYFWRQLGSSLESFLLRKESDRKSVVL